MKTSNVRWLALLLIFLLACTPLAVRPAGETQTLTADIYYDKVHGAWQATIASQAGWDADNNMATSAGLLGIILAFDGLPEAVQTSADVYFNEDVTGDLPQYDTVSNIAWRTQALAEQAIVQAGGVAADGMYIVPSG